AAATRTFGPYQIHHEDQVQGGVGMGAIYPEGYTTWGTTPLVCVGLSVGANTTLTVQESHDGLNFFNARAFVIATAVFIYKATCVPVIARFFQVLVNNTSGGVATYGMTILASYMWSLSVPITGADL
ncbi:MAG TPA: hypothetical protein VKF62_14570, partial [Planctomycetota bacterium]|nr:hypothetical protein [Planctomycetota bacterium]